MDQYQIEVQQAQERLAAANKRREEALELQRQAAAAEVAKNKAAQEAELERQRKERHAAEERAMKKRREAEEAQAQAKRDQEAQDRVLEQQMNAAEEAKRLHTEQQKRLAQLSEEAFAAERESERLTAEALALSKPSAPTYDPDLSEHTAETGTSGISALFRRAGVNLQFPDQVAPQFDAPKVTEIVLPLEVNQVPALHPVADDTLTLPSRLPIGKLDEIAPVVHPAPEPDEFMDEGTGITWDARIKGDN